LDIQKSTSTGQPTCKCTSV